MAKGARRRRTSRVTKEKKNRRLLPVFIGRVARDLKYGIVPAMVLRRIRACLNVVNKSFSWLLAAIAVFAGAIASFYYGEESYSIPLVLLGWVLLLLTVVIIKRTPTAQQMWNERGRIAFGLIGLLVLLGGLGDILIYFAPTETWGYAVKYGVDTSKIVIEKQPHNCEWDSAPLGNKHCHYDADVQVTKTTTGADGKTPIVSLDGGKTWMDNTSHLESSAFVSWSKVED
jgi:hypothetical protein